MAAKKPKEPDGLKIDKLWEKATAKLASTPASAFPKRVAEPRKAIKSSAA